MSADQCLFCRGCGAPFVPVQRGQCSRCGSDATPVSADDNAAEQAREVDDLRRWKAEAMEVMSGLQEVGKALGVGLGERITARATVDRALDLRNERDAVLAEVQRLRASIETERQEAARKALLAAAAHARHPLNTAPSISGYDRETVAVWLLDRADGVTGREDV